MNANDFGQIDAQDENRELVQISPDEGVVTEIPANERVVFDSGDLEYKVDTKVLEVAKTVSWDWYYDVDKFFEMPLNEYVAYKAKFAI